MPRKRSALLPLAALLLCGCTSTNPHCHGGMFVCEHRTTDKPETTCAPYKATYVLYQWKSPPADQPPPHAWSPEQGIVELYVRTLESGQTVGFEKGDKDELFAVAGDEKILLEPGRYCWHITRETEPSRFRQAVHETFESVSELLAAVIALPLGIVLAAVIVVVLIPLFILFLPILAIIGLVALCGMLL